MNNLFEKINKIEDTDELTNIYFGILNSENKLEPHETELTLDLWKTKEVIRERIDFILSNKGLVGVS